MEEKKKKMNKPLKVTLWAFVLFLPIEAVVGLLAGFLGFSLTNYHPVMSFVLGYIIVWIFITLRENKVAHKK